MQQNSGLQQITRALIQLDQVIQQNRRGLFRVPRTVFNGGSAVKIISVFKIEVNDRLG